MNYLSTRGGLSPAPFREILLGGLAPDGGLVVPEHYSRIEPETLAAYRTMDYRAIAFDLLSRYMTDIEPAMLRTLIDRAYSADVFGSDAIAGKERSYQSRVGRGDTFSSQLPEGGNRRRTGEPEGRVPETERLNFEFLGIGVD